MLCKIFLMFIYWIISAYLFIQYPSKLKCICLKKINYFVFIIHQVNKHGVSRWFTEADVKNFVSYALRTITNITRDMVNWKKEFLHSCISKILFIDTEQLSKVQISSQVFFKDFVDRFGSTYFKNEFFWNSFSKILLMFFRIAINLKTGSSKKYSWKILFIDSKTSLTKTIHLKVR